MIDILKVHSFSENLIGGNLAGVVCYTDDLYDEKMQEIAQYVGASETVFILPSKRADIRLRWFTPNTEVGICAHATIAALYVLRKQHHLTANTLKIETKLADIQAELRGQEIFIKMPDYHKSAQPITLSDILPLLPMDSDQIVQSPGIVEILTDRELLIEVRTLSALKKLVPDLDRYGKICHQLNVTGISIFTRETIHKKNHIHTREFAPLYGYLEDPICGMAAGAISTYLVNEPFLHIEQGHFCETSGLITVENKNDGIWIGGACHLVNQEKISI